MKAYKLLAILLLIPCLAAAGERPVKPSSSMISDETHRAHKVGNRAISFWWLPVEYWQAAARELGKSTEEVDRLGDLLELYCILALVDAQVSSEGSVQFESADGVNEKLKLVVGTQRVGPAARVDPELRRVLPELSYFMATGLGGVAGGLRLVLFPNVDEAGRPQVTASSGGEIHAVYTPEGDEPITLLWHAPLTAVVGPKRCPKGGEQMQASWLYCPWHGAPLD